MGSKGYDKYVIGICCWASLVKENEKKLNGKGDGDSFGIMSLKRTSPCP